MKFDGREFTCGNFIRHESLSDANEDDLLSSVESDKLHARKRSYGCGRIQRLGNCEIKARTYYLLQSSNRPLDKKPFSCSPSNILSFFSVIPPIDHRST